MPEVVDLLSSSPVPVTKNTTAQAPSLPPLSKALTYEAEKRKNDTYIMLSSDSDGAGSYLPPPKPAPKPSIPHAYSNAEASMNATTKLASKKMKSDVFFMSDDFDSTVNLDASVLDLPPAKKPRLSPPSGSRITKSQGYQSWLDRLEDSASTSPPDVSASGPAQKISGLQVGAVDKPVAPKPVAESSSNTASSGPQLRASSSKAAPKASINRRSISDLGAVSKPIPPKASIGMRRSKTLGAALDSDPIVFTSSPDPRADAKERKDNEKKKRKERINAILGDSSDSDVFDLETPKMGKKSDKDMNGMPSMGGAVLLDFEFESSDEDLPDIGDLATHIPRSITSKDKANASSKPRKPKTVIRKAPLTALEKYEAERAKEKAKKEKEQLAKDKASTKEAEKEAKRQAKEEKAREKDRATDLAKVNVLRTDKKKSTREMIVDLPSCLPPKLSEQLEKYLGAVEAKCETYNSTRVIIQWRRRTDAEFDEEAGHWEKVESYVREEKHIACIMTAKEFVDLATGEEGNDLDSHVLQLKAKFPTKDILYLIEGLDPWMKRNKNVQNRKYVEQVRSQMPAEEATANQKRKKKPEPEYVDEDLIEDSLLKLQVIHGVLIHHTRVMVETAEWVVVFTQHISTIPYKLVEQDLDVGFCMDTGQVKAGNGPADTYTRMLQEMVRITPAVAYSIAAKYPTVQKLVQGMRGEGPLALQNCRKTANKDGAFTDKKIGLSISKRVHSVFTCKDPGSWEV